MEATISMESLWQMIQTLSPDNRQWLSNRLQEERMNEKDDFLLPDEDLKRAISAEKLLVGVEADIRTAYRKRYDA